MAVRLPSLSTSSDVSARSVPAPITITQYRLSSIAAVWASAAVPMAAIAWVAAPLTSRALGGPAPLVSALFLSLTAGLVWQCALVLFLVRREQGSLRLSVLKEALWLRAPRSPRTGRSGGRVWLMLMPFIALFAAEQFVPALPGPVNRHFATFLGSGTGHAFFHGSWGWFALVVVMGLFNTVLGEELLFRGLLLPG